MPALFTRTSRPPNRSTVSDIAARTTSGSSLSAWTARAWPPEPMISRSRLFAGSLASRYVNATAAPSAASLRTMPAPIPGEPPVKNARRPASGAVAMSSSRAASVMMPPYVSNGSFTYCRRRMQSAQPQWEGRSPGPDCGTRAILYRIVRLLYQVGAVTARRFEDGRARQATSVRRGRGPRRRDAAVLEPRLRWHVDERPHRGDGYQPAQRLCRVRQQGGAVHRGVGALPCRPRSVRGQGAGAPDRPGGRGVLPSRHRGGGHVVGPSVRLHDGAVRADLQRRGSGRPFRRCGPASGWGGRLPRAIRPRAGGRRYGGPRR